MIWNPGPAIVRGFDFIRARSSTVLIVWLGLAFLLMVGALFAPSVPMALAGALVLLGGVAAMAVLGAGLPPDPRP